MPSYTKKKYYGASSRYHAKMQALYDQIPPGEIAAMRKVNRWLFDNRYRAIEIVGRERFIATWKTFFDGTYQEAWGLVQEYDKALSLAETHPLGTLLDMPDVPEWCDNDADPWDAEYALRAQELRDEAEAS